MALARGKYGIEYNPAHMDDDSSGLGWIVLAVVVVALLSLAWTLVSRFRSADPADVEVVQIEPVPAEPVAAPVAPAPVAEPEKTVTPTPEAPPQVVAAPAKAEPPPPSQEPVTASLVRRPVKVRNLLMRLEEAEKRHDVEMAVTTIEAIRALPGSPAADLDDKLARRLGKLNVRRLFTLKNAQWVKTVTVKRGDSASRIAAENGSTLASLARLNGGKVDKVVLGKPLFVMNHPRFNLVIHRRSRTADLSLNGRFFKRYDLVGGVTGKEGAYELPARTRNFWLGELGVQFRPEDRAELELLMPIGAAVLISEM